MIKIDFMLIPIPFSDGTALVPPFLRTKKSSGSGAPNHIPPSVDVFLSIKQIIRGSEPVLLNRQQILPGLSICRHCTLRFFTSQYFLKL